MAIIKTVSDYFGFLNLHKPAGMTSHDCIGKLRRLLHMKRIGHGGTLDPLAIGVLPVALGPATRLLNYLPTSKTYRATVRLGLTTTTDDLAGGCLSRGSEVAIAALSLAQIDPVLAKFVGPLTQIPPAYSAIHIKGQRAYDLARQGKTVELPPRAVTIHHLNRLAWRPPTPATPPEIDLEIHCSAGTYIRAIARDIGAQLGVGGTLAHLHRTVSGGMSETTSLTFAALETALAHNTFQPTPVGEALQHLPKLTLEPGLAQRFCWGQKLTWPPENTRETLYRVHQQDDVFLGVGLIAAGLLRAKVVPPSQAD